LRRRLGGGRRRAITVVVVALVSVAAACVALSGSATWLAQRRPLPLPLRTTRVIAWMPAKGATGILGVSDDLTPAAYLSLVQRNYAEGSVVIPTAPHASATPTLSPTHGASSTATPSPTQGASNTPTPTATRAAGATPTLTGTASPGATSTRTPTPTITVTPSATGTVPSDPPASVFGVTGPAHDQAQLLGTQAGARWYRTAIYWRAVEPTDMDLTDPSSGFWPDNDLRNLTDHGYDVILTIGENPDWAVETVYGNNRCGPIDAEDLDEFEEFVHALVERYDGDGFKDAPGGPILIEHIEAYNEPDKDFDHAAFGCWAADGSPAYANRYAVALQSMWRGAHSANPNAVVLFGGIGAEEGTGSDFAIGGGDWLDDVLSYIEANPDNYFDWFNIHVYWFFRDRWTGYGGEDIIGKVNYFRQRLTQHGLDKPIAITETTLPSNGYGSDELQSRYAVQVYARTIASGVPATTWHRLVDLPGESQYGLLDTRGSPKPAYQAYAVAANKLAQARYLRELDVPDVEGYVYGTPGGAEVTVLWAISETPITVTFPDSPLRVVDKWGSERVEPDNTVDVTASPLYVEPAE
jgi:hypothetical protein